MQYTGMDRKRSVIELRIISEVKRYHAVFNHGMQMNILSAKYARALVDLGGFPETIAAMELAGVIRIEVKESGARLVYPGMGDAPKFTDAAKWF